MSRARPTSNRVAPSLTTFAVAAPRLQQTAKLRCSTEVIDELLSDDGAEHQSLSPVEQRAQSPIFG
jgi:hypothetical protein